ncbi:hypothetical protein [Rhodococcus maanshanensis]|uniref:Uncharacterized protein n=1 Tax=Rhodococcus maanshanensis TaxID=183556 RepID=A0A1H7SJ29_9NOCA|nr:hypothetical protein [Rhodococcus maanshanensis]SEL72515.1 hypothetical protein SAMN05444583_113111 [Rhodococcus maanshanensis]
MNAGDWTDDYQPCPEDGPFTLIVGGEVFTVELRSRTEYDYTWESGPNDGYGFSSTMYIAGDPAAEPPLLTIQQHRESIRGFVGSIDPETGYLD